MFDFMDNHYVLGSLGMFFIIFLATVVWRVLNQNETMKREKDLMKFNMMKQEKKHKMILSRAMKENRELRNSTRKVLSDIETERKKIGQLLKMTAESAKRENRRKDARGNNSHRGQHSCKTTRTGNQEFDFFNSINTMLGPVGSVLSIGMNVYKLFKK